MRGRLVVPNSVAEEQGIKRDAAAAIFHKEGKATAQVPCVSNAFG
jgi:hypothetical protein